MIVYRILKYEGSAPDIAKMFRLSIHGEYGPGGLQITAAPVEPRIVESTPMLLHALQQVAGKRWEPPLERAPAAVKSNPFGAAIGAADSEFDFDREATNFLARIDDMLENGGFDWASDTLTGIRETVERVGRVTERQRAAIDNIENAGHEGHRR